MQQDDVTGSPGAVTWRRSSAAEPGVPGIEVAALPGGDVAVRSSAHPDRPALVYTRAEIRAFIQGAKDGEFDDLIS